MRTGVEEYGLTQDNFILYLKTINKANVFEITY
jgi:hypothetical protein